MRKEPTRPTAHIAETTIALLERVLPAERSFAVRLWDGTTLPPPGRPAAEAPATLVLTHEDALPGMLQLPVDVSVGEAYLRGDVDVEGDLETAFEFLDHAELALSPADWLRVAADAAKLRRHGSGPSKSGTAGVGPVAHVAAKVRGRMRSRERDRQAIAHHYDVSNAFYALWLDARMVYSCGYFPTDDATLDAAQEAKLDLICRKLRLQAGERLLDIGCGWGALPLHAAERYGVEALGITLSEKQLALARERAGAAGLAGRVAYELRDYRDLDGTFDKIASVGMAEHVGRDMLPRYFEEAYAHLRPGGLMLNHAIHRGPVRAAVDERVISGEFMRRYVFPDGEILPLWQSLEAAEGAGFEVRDVEDLREHYAQTLRCWVRNLEARWDEAVDVAGHDRTRLWRLYMAGSAHRFAAGHLAIHQALLAKPDAKGRVALPRTRADLYA